MPKRKTSEGVVEADIKRMKGTHSSQQLTTLPNEILHHILKDVEIPDTARYEIFYF